MKVHVFFLLVLAGGLAMPLQADDWLRWVGPHGDFTLDSAPLADSWPEAGPPLLWKRPLGDGYSSILARDGRLYTVYRDGEEEVIVCLDAGTGSTLTMARISPTDLEVLGSHSITESVSWTLPTLVDGKLYVRDRKQILAPDLGRPIE